LATQDQAISIDRNIGKFTTGTLGKQPNGQPADNWVRWTIEHRIGSE